MSPNRLHTLHADSVDLVGKAACRRRFMLLKADDLSALPTGMQLAALDELDALAATRPLTQQEAADRDVLAQALGVADEGDDDADTPLAKQDTLEEPMLRDKGAHDSERRATLLQRVERERAAEVEQARRDVHAVAKAHAPDPVDGVMVAIHVVEKGDAPAAATIAAEKDRRKQVLGQHDPFLSPAQRSARVEKSAGGACLSAIANDPRATSLDLRTLLETLVAEGNGDLVQRTAFELRGT